MRYIESYGSVKDGKLNISYRDKFYQSIATMEDCRVKIKVEKLYRKRSTSTIRDDGTTGRGQNGYYWMIVLSFYQQGAWEVQQRQLTKEQAHEELKTNCNYQEVYNEATGSVMRITRTTTMMTTVEFEEYLSRCREWINEWFGSDVPLPNEQGKLI